MSNWPKEDKNSFNKSEVMLEFEKRIVEAATFLSNEISKIAQDQNISNKINQVKALNDELQKAKNTMDSMNQAKDGELVNNLDADIVETGSQSDMLQEEDLEIINNDSSEAKMAMIEEMNYLVKQAVKEGNYKVAYEIERTISEILDGE